jgi:hypothetical protein
MARIPWRFGGDGLRVAAGIAAISLLFLQVTCAPCFPAQANADFRTLWTGNEAGLGSGHTIPYYFSVPAAGSHPLLLADPLPTGSP